MNIMWLGFWLWFWLLSSDSINSVQLNLCTFNAMKLSIVLEGQKWESRKLLLKDIAFEMAMSQESGRCSKAWRVVAISECCDAEQGWHFQWHQTIATEGE